MKSKIKGVKNMIALSENTLEKYEKGYKKASTILCDYIGKSHNIIEKLQEKSKPEIPEENEILYYSLKEYNTNRLKKDLSIQVKTNLPDDFILFGIVTKNGKENSSIVAKIYINNTGNKILIPEKNYLPVFKKLIRLT